MPTKPWHSHKSEHVVEHLETDAAEGLGHRDARERLSRVGPNVIETEQPRTLTSIVLAQFQDLLIVILLIAASLSAFLGELGDTIAIAVIVVLNAVVGATQEFRAQRAVAALRELSALEARVVRGGKDLQIPAAELVPGDLVTLEAGNVVPADVRLIESNDLSTDESVLTGEALPVEKQTEAVANEAAPLGDRLSMAYKSTAVTRGRGLGVVVATGLATEIGRIADLLGERSDKRTPLQQRLTVFGRRLAMSVVAICALIFGVGLAAGEPPVLMFLVAVSLAVAAIPEALPAVVTVTLAVGARKLGRLNSLVRSLAAVETLGSVTYICTDKTGTLTENRMTFGGGATASQEFAQLAELPAPVRDALVRGIALCHESWGEGRADPTELALQQAADAAGGAIDALLERYPLEDRIPFDPERKLMATVHRDGDTLLVLVKGAPEAVIARADEALCPDGSTEALNVAALLAAAHELAARGQRVLSVALKRVPATAKAAASASETVTATTTSPANVTAPASGPAIADEDIDSGLVFIGHVGLKDPIRAEVPGAIASCRRAGITPVLVTGDHPATARQIALEAGFDMDAEIITGPELAQLDETTLERRTKQIRVYARVDPAQKIRIVRALQANGEVVAMTGDGVNDAPALKQASIGVAMGGRGTDVARETADLVLLDDNFATIVAAVREGRRIYDNIRKFIRYTMTSNAGEISVLLLAPLVGLPIPLLPIQILWINLVTDGLPGLAFSAEPADASTMHRPPRPPRESVLSKPLLLQMLWIGLLLAALALSTAASHGVQELARWQTMVFTTLVTGQLFQALALRSEHLSLFTIGLFTNRYMLATVIGTLLAQIAVVYVPALNAVLHTTPLAPTELLLCIGLGSAVLPIVELQKWLSRRLASTG